MFHSRGAFGIALEFFFSFLECTENEESLTVLMQPAATAVGLNSANKWQCIIKNSSSIQCLFSI